ncbi:P-loop containing nucleoside triphosphate hydrolase protein [Lindgomyces ingoldianus]|uniref:P-loop containing nucleoside triphosphate hydrolase protein n=1 Tax=Lindgomyces ingoldianus TaxID=673940 RepID=A0ACB6QJ26_9PLEO|nr:P-loop containing nucleoside triphosphate hydrolase protein [Lindgomyces ingoldianus]KAF2466936.1 P-loop containing nucleoside triphosphate hydrolase protein [Lindgomyces ingoldianus]
MTGRSQFYQTGLVHHGLPIPAISNIYQNRSALIQDLPDNGIVPTHQKNSVSQGLPILEILQRVASRLRPGYSLDSILATVALYRAAFPVFAYLKQLFTDYFTSTVSIYESDAAAKEIMEWMVVHVMQKGTTNGHVVTGGVIQDPFTDYMLPQPRKRSQATNTNNTSSNLHSTLPMGNKVFWIGLRPFKFSRAFPYSAGDISASRSRSRQGQSSIHVSTLGRSLSPLHEFLQTCRDFKIRNKGETTTIYFIGANGGPYLAHGHWSAVRKSVRRLDTVDMDATVKEELIRDAEDYYLPETKYTYTDSGIPYRRGYLFHGPPGTGKTSFSAALSSHLECDIYMIDLAANQINDSYLHMLFLSLPEKCVVVIEDIDSAGIGRQKSAEPIETDDDMYVRAPRLTLSGLLNAIDGTASQEGRLLIMTSNNPDSLDEALIRPGRIDKKIYFGYVSLDVAKSMFMRLVGRAAVASGIDQTEIQGMSEAFSKFIPEDAVTPAQLQNFLQGCRGDPKKALLEVSDWAAGMM